MLDETASGAEVVKAALPLICIFDAPANLD